jgi:hypothetical protein
MSLLRTIGSAPLAGPLKGLLWIVETVAAHAERELYDEDNIRKDLMKLEQQFELDQISIEEFENVEGMLLERLNQARRMKEGS